jgi:hypothetical protein
MHFFGEIAQSGNGGKAAVNGVLVSVDPKVEISLLHRSLSKSYQSLYANAFTEGTQPANENGLYMGIGIKLTKGFRIDGYADMYKSNWLRFQVSAPGSGRDYLTQLTYKPGKTIEIYARYKYEQKPANNPIQEYPIDYTINQTKQNIRLNTIFKISRHLTLRNRAEMVLFKEEKQEQKQGFVVYQDLVYKPLGKPYNLTARLAYFGTDNYDTRLYTYENDVLYSFSIPSLYDSGLRYYAMYNHNILKNLEVWLRFSQTIYNNKTLIGSGLDEIKGNKKSEVKVQLRYSF